MTTDTGASTEVDRETDAAVDIAVDAAVDATVGSGADAHARLARVLEFERRWWGGATGRKEVRIRHEFGWSPARYYQVLNALLDEEAALRYDPVLVGRLREVRAMRAELRRTRRPGAGVA